MNLPLKILNKYEFVTYEQFFKDTGMDMREYCRVFLSHTDHIPLKLIEGAISAADVAEELKYREIARQEIAKISGQPYEPRENQKTLDERTEAAEANIDYIALMTDVEIPTEA